jgi:hypothetical protein
LIFHSWPIKHSFLGDFTIYCNIFKIIVITWKERNIVWYIMFLVPCLFELLLLRYPPRNLTAWEENIFKSCVATANRFAPWLIKIRFNCSWIRCFQIKLLDQYSTPGVPVYRNIWVKFNEKGTRNIDSYLLSTWPICDGFKTYWNMPCLFKKII